MKNFKENARFLDLTYLSQSYPFSKKKKVILSPVVMFRCESWTIKKAEHWRINVFWIMVLEKTPENPLDCKEIKPVNPKRNLPWILIRRTDAEAEAPILWPPDVKSWLIRKDPDAGKDWGKEEKGMAEDEMVGWHHRLNGYESLWRTGKPGRLQSMGSQRVGHS